MRRGFAIVAVVLLLLAGVGIGLAAYNAGVDHGIDRQLAESGQGVQVVRLVGDRVGPGFGFLLVPLFLFGIFALVRAATWRARWGAHGHSGHGGWKGHAGDRFDEWHRQQHERGGATSAGGEPA